METEKRNKTEITKKIQSFQDLKKAELADKIRHGTNDTAWRNQFYLPWPEINSIALHGAALTSPDYIKLKIENQKKNKTEGWRRRSRIWRICWKQLSSPIKSVAGKPLLEQSKTICFDALPYTANLNLHLSLFCFIILRRLCLPDLSFHKWRNKIC